MSLTLMAIVTILYLCTGISLWWGGRMGLGIAFAAYALANLGLMWDVWVGGKG